MMRSPSPQIDSAALTSRAGGFLRWAAVGLALLVIALRVALTRPLQFCGTPDACFYLGMGQNLAAGRGFHARFLYDFQQAHPALPNTGLEYWRPGVSIFLLLLKPFGGVTLQSSIVLTILVGVLLAAAAWHVARRAFGETWVALASFAFCLLCSPVSVGSASPDSSLYYGAAVAWFLALFTVRRQGLWQDLVALLCVCLAYMVRNDAAMLLVPLCAVLWARHRRVEHVPNGQGGSSARYAVLMLAGFVVALVPMHLLYRHVLGTAFPSGTAQTLFLNDLSDFGRYKDPVSLHTLLAHGVVHLLAFRVSTLATLLYRFAVLMLGYPALVFLPGLFVGKRTGDSGDTLPPASCLPELLGPASFGLAALLAYTIVLPAVGGFAGLRTAVGLLPVASVLVMVAVVRVARTPRLAIWVAGCVIAATALASVMDARRNLPVANELGSIDRSAAQALAHLGADPARAVVLSNDPVQFAVTTGYATVALPNNGLEAVAAAAHDFQASHIILDSETLPSDPAVLTRLFHPVGSVMLSREHLLILELPQTQIER